MISAQELQQLYSSNNHFDDQHLANEDLVNPLTGAPFSSNYRALLAERKKLTIWQHKQQFMDILDRPNIQFILLEAETGSGKTTQIPQWCVEWIRKRPQPYRRQMVCCTQPRRLATTNIAKRVAKEMDVQLGREVGYSIRFDDDVCVKTVLKYCTDGILLAEATRNNNLDKYGVIVLDEVHERKLDTDVLMGLIKDIEKICARIREFQFGPFAGKLLCLPFYSTLQPEEQQKIFSKPPKTALSAAGMPFDRRCIVATNIAETSMTIEGVVYVIDPGYCKRKEFDPQSRMESLLIRPITQASAIQRAGRAGRTRPGKCFRLYSESDFRGMKLIEPEIRHSNLANVLLRMKKSGVPDLYRFDFIDAPPPELLAQSIALLTHLEALDDTGRLTPLGFKMADLPVDPQRARMLIESVRLNCVKQVVRIVAMLSSPNDHFIRPKNMQFEANYAKSRLQHDQGDHLTLLRVYNNFTKCSNDIYGRMDWCYQNFMNYNSLQYAADVCRQLEDVMRRRLNIDFESAHLPNDPTMLASNITKALLAGSFMKVAFFKQKDYGNQGKARKKGHYITVESLMPAEQQQPTIATSSLTKMPITHPQIVPPYQIDSTSVLFRTKVYRKIRPEPEWILYESAIQLNGGQNYLRTVTSIRPEWLIEMAPKFYEHARTVCPELNLQISSCLVNDAITKEIAKLVKFGVTI